MAMAMVVVLILTLFVAGVAHLLMKSKKGRGPLALPVIGHLHLLYGSLPHHSLFRLSKTYGPLMLLQFGAIPTLVVSNAQAAEQVLHVHGKNFLSRPAFTIVEHLTYNCQDMAFVPYGKDWKRLRKICATLLLSRSRLESFKALRMDMVSLMMDSVSHVALANGVLHLRSLVSETIFNIVTMMLISKRYFGSGVASESEVLQFITLQSEKMNLSAFFYVGDFLPFLKLFKFLDPNLRALKRLHHSLDMFLQGILDKRRSQKKGEQDLYDILDLLLSIARDERLSDDVIKALIQDLLDGATDTTSTVTEWAIAELIRHPQALKDLKQELGKVVGERSLDESHLLSLPYLDCVVKETLRLHPTLPLLIPRQSIEPCIIESLAIPKNAMLIVNWFAIGQDPAYWEQPKEFLPNRFMHQNHGPKCMFIPFGAGRRSCPGELLGLTMVKVVVGSLIHRFDWGLENGLRIADLDMSGDVGSIVHMKNPLKLVPSFASQLEH